MHICAHTHTQTSHSHVHTCTCKALGEYRGEKSGLKKALLNYLNKLQHIIQRLHSSFPTQICARIHIRAHTHTHTHTQTNVLHAAACTLAHARHSEYRGEKSGLKKALQQKTWHVPPSCIHWVKYSFSLMSSCEFGAGCVRVGVYVEASVCVCALQLKQKI